MKKIFTDKKKCCTLCRVFMGCVFVSFWVTKSTQNAHSKNEYKQLIYNDLHGKYV